MEITSSQLNMHLTISPKRDHVPGLCFLGIDGTPYISHKIMAQNHIFRLLL